MNIKKEQTKKDVSTKNHKAWIGGYILLAIAALSFYLLIKFDIIKLILYRLPLLRLTLAASVIFSVMSLSIWVTKILVKKSHSKAIRYNMVRLVRLLTIFTVLLLVVSFINENWYTAAVSLGLFSLILGFALQTPITSLIGWIYIVFRLPYRVGDRIEISTFKGDVIDIDYLDTTLWEFGGDYMTSDVPSGRLIRFPNSLVLQSGVLNYSWKKFPYIWNEIPFHVAYESDLSFIEETVHTMSTQILGKEMLAHVEQLKGYLKETAIDELDIKNYPYVQFRINANTWVEVLLVYLVLPKEAAAVRTKLIKAILATLVKEPDKVMFPKSNSR